MQDNTTTIQIRLDQRDALQERKQHDRESYKAVLDRLLADEDARDDGNAEAIADAVAERVGADAPVAWDQPDVSDLAERTAEHIEQRDNVTLDASERRKIADEVTEQLR